MLWWHLGWAFATAKTIFARAVEKTGKNCGNTGISFRHFNIIFILVVASFGSILDLKFN